MAVFQALDLINNGEFLPSLNNADLFPCPANDLHGAVDLLRLMRCQNGRAQPPSTVLISPHHTMGS